MLSWISRWIFSIPILYNTHCNLILPHYSAVSFKILVTTCLLKGHCLAFSLPDLSFVITDYSQAEILSSLSKAYDSAPTTLPSASLSTSLLFSFSCTEYLVGPRSQPGLSSVSTSPIWDSTVGKSKNCSSWESWALTWSLLLTPLRLHSPFPHEQNQDATTYLKICWKYEMRKIYTQCLASTVHGVYEARNPF